LYRCAIPAHSPLLPPILGRHKRSSHPDLPLTWPHPVGLGTPPDLQIALRAALPFEHGAVVIDGFSAWGDDVQLHMYGGPWVQEPALALASRDPLLQSRRHR
jgi:hypothetical protein